MGTAIQTVTPFHYGDLTPELGEKSIIDRFGEDCAQYLLNVEYWWKVRSELQERLGGTTVALVAKAA
jgi:hypothetical protein